MNITLTAPQSRIVTAVLSAHSKWGECDFCAALRSRFRSLGATGGGTINLSQSERVLCVGCLLAERMRCGENSTIQMNLAHLEETFGPI